MDVVNELSKFSLKSGTGSKKSFAKLQEMLVAGAPDEVVLAGAAGRLQRNQDHAPVANGSYVVVTSQRVILTAQGLVFTGGFEAPVHEVACEISGKGLRWSLLLRSLAWDYIFMNSNEQRVRALEAAIVRQQRQHASYALTDAIAAAGSVTDASSADLPAQLERLGSLRASGVLSEEEFTLAKNRLLGSSDEAP